MEDGKLNEKELVYKLSNANESVVIDILTSLGIGWHDSQIVDRILYQETVPEMIGILHQLTLHRDKYKQCMEGYEPPDNSSVCPKVFDGLTCWNETAAGTIAYASCPGSVQGFDPSLFGHKECLLNGTWFRHPDSNLIWSNYTTCVNLQDFQMTVLINLMYEVGYCISTLALVISLVIFCSFKCLECTRVKIHRNLFASFIIDNLLWVAWYRLIVSNEQVITTNPYWCKWLFVLVQYFLIANYFWMFCEGLYLHTLLVYTFLRSESQLLKGFYLFGWLGPVVPMSFYVYLRFEDGYQHDVACWIEPRHQWFVTAPVCISLLCNLIFLISILRVLLNKLNNQRYLRNPNGPATTLGSSPENQYSLRKAVRATLILIPLLGIHYLLLPFRPAPGTSMEIVYDIVGSLSASLQGLCVAILFCWCNSEVVAVLKRKICQKFCMRRQGTSHNVGNRCDSAIPTSGCDPIPILNGNRNRRRMVDIEEDPMELDTAI